MAKDPNIYWNPIFETLPQDKLQELQFKKLRRILE